MTAYGQPKDGITADTPQSILLDAGTIHKGLQHGYYLLTAQPADWTTNYTAYYTRSGSEGSYTYEHVTGSTAPEWAANTYYNSGWNFEESLFFATGDGNTFKVEPEITDLEVDGAWVKVEGLQIKTGETVTLEVTPVEIKPEMLKAALIAQEGTSNVAGFDVLESKEIIETGDYVDNLAYVGTKVDGTPIVIILPRAICTSGLELAGKNKDKVVPTLTFEAVAPLTGSHRTIPYKIYYPTPAQG